MWLPPQITQGRVRQAASQAADWLHHAARGVVLAGAVGTGNTVVRVLISRTITSRGDVRRAGAVLSRRTGHDTANGVTQGSRLQGRWVGWVEMGSTCAREQGRAPRRSPRRRGHWRSSREGQNQRYQGQHNLVRCRRRPLVECRLYFALSAEYCLLPIASNIIFDILIFDIFRQYRQYSS